MVCKRQVKFGFLALCLYIIRMVAADPMINERQEENLARWGQHEKYHVSSAIIKMTSCIPLNSTTGWKQLSAFQKYPGNFDVAFAVGPKKTIVRAPRLILISSSLLLEREVNTHFEILKNGEEIPLPTLDPEAFKLFVELLIFDTWSRNELEALQLPFNQLLHLMSICEKYGMTRALRNLTEVAKDYFGNFETHVKPEDFLLLSEAQLEKILASDELYMNETDVYKCALSWADEQCKMKNLDSIGTNLRLVLGSCLYQIRFPVMSLSEFVTLSKVNELLSAEEIIEIARLIEKGENSSKSYNTTELKFKVENRKTNPWTSVPRGSSKVSLTQVFPVIDTPYVGEGRLRGYQAFNMNMKITLHGLGFLGPIGMDSFYDVRVQIEKYANEWSNITDVKEKRLFAQKSKTFYFIFDQPIVLDPIPHDSWKNNYGIRFSLKGPDTRSLQSTKGAKRIYDDNKEFVIFWNWSQVVEIIYTTF